MFYHTFIILYFVFSLKNTFIEARNADYITLVHTEEMVHPLPGDVIIVKGHVKPNPVRFAVDLVTGVDKSTTQADVALHVNPRFDKSSVVINHALANGVWGNEQSQHIQKFNLQPNNDFTMEIHVAESGYNITINGMHCDFFAHIIPLKRISTLEVHDDVTVTSVQVGPPKYHSLSKSSWYSHNDLAFVYSRNLLPVKEGDLFIVQGLVHPNNPDRFSVDLLATPPSNKPNSADTALHVDPRLSHKDVNIASNVDGTWSQSSFSDGVPFALAPGLDYSVSIFVRKGSFSIQVNGFQFDDYEFRVPIDQIYGIVVRGTVTVKKVIVHQQSHLIAIGEHDEDLAKLADAATKANEESKLYIPNEANITRNTYIDPNCTDNPYFNNCHLMMKGGFCKHVYYGKFCCRSCTMAGLLSPNASLIIDDTKSSMDNKSLKRK